MLFSKVVLALAAVTAVAALPAPAKPTSKAPATKLTAQSKPKSAAAKQKSYNNKVAAAKKNTKTKPVKGANGKTTTSVIPATTTVAPAPAAATAAVVAATTVDSGIANTILGCLNPDGKTSCFEILGDLKDDCFTMPRPLAGNVQFFAPPPTGVCSLFTDVNCLQGEEPKVAGVTQNAAVVAWSCTDAATAAAADAKAAADAAAQVSSSVAAASTSAAAAATTAAADASTTVAANTAAAVETDNAKFGKPGKLTSKGKPMTAAAKAKQYANKVAKAKASQAAGTTTNAAAAATATATLDSGIANTIIGCENPDGKDQCFEIQGDLKGDCFTIPPPLLNNVAFFVVPPTGVCSLFTDADCTQGEQAKVDGVTKSKAAAGWSCVDQATSDAADAQAAKDAAAALASSSSAAAASTTAAAANTAVATKGKAGKLTSKGKPMSAAAKAKQYANKVAKAKAAQAAGTTTNAAAAATATATLDSGIANTIEGCTNPDGKTGCFEIQGDLKGDCFTIPPPLLNNVQFFVVPPTGVCSLFSDADCTQGEQAKVDGVVKNKAAAAWSCVDQATSDAADAQAAKDAAAALASSSAAAASTTVAANTAAVANTAAAVETDAAHFKGKAGKLTSKGKAMTAAAKAKQYANKVAKAKAAQAAGTTTNAAAAATATATLDSGIANTIVGCTNSDGKTGCFEIQGDLKGDCFTIPPPLLNNVQFFIVPPTGVCSLFTDADCTQGEQAKVDGVTKSKAAAGWSCVDSATAAAADAQAAKDAAAALASSSSAAAAATGKANTAAVKSTSTKATAKATSTKATAKATSTKAATNTAAATKSTPTKLTAKAKKPMTKAAKAKQYANLVAKAKAAQKGGKKTVTKGKDGKTTTSTAAATTTAPPAANTAAANVTVDSGIKNVILSCEDKDQKTCFEILGDLSGDCFTFPRPIANNVAFFLPPPTGVCSLFSDENCSAGEQAAVVGASTSPVVNSWSCVDQATADATAAQAAADAAAQASSSAAAASTTDAAAASTTDSAPPAANTAVATSTLDTGIANVVELCEDAKQKTCFDMAVDTEESCFTLPTPIAKNVAFFIPPPDATCTLFTDANCSKGAAPGSGATKNKSITSLSCVPATA